MISEVGRIEMERLPVVALPDEGIATINYRMGTPELRRAMAATDLYLALLRHGEYLREVLKHGRLSLSARKALEEMRDQFAAQLSELGIDMEAMA